MIRGPEEFHPDFFHEHMNGQRVVVYPAQAGSTPPREGP